MFQNGDRIVVADGHEQAGREGVFLYTGNTPYTAGKARIKLDAVRKRGNTTSLFVEKIHRYGKNYRSTSTNCL